MKACMQTVESPGRSDLLRLGIVDRQRKEDSHYLNEPPLYELLVSGKKAVIDLREDHLSRCVRSRGRRSEEKGG